jgi:integrating conjugative element protein (TIGR03756 family)
LVVTVYDEIGFDPWTEMNIIYAPFNLAAAETILGFVSPFPIVAGGEQTEGTAPINEGMMEDKSLRFKEAAAYGHPMASLSNFTAGMGLCPSEATSLVPYFQSPLDSLEWRFGLLEMFSPSAFIPGARVVGLGGFFQQWGPVFPRTGFVKQKDDPMAGAVIAQRVGNIITGNSGLHVAGHLGGNGYGWTVLPGELIENVPWTGVWQMIAPIPDPVCYPFGLPIPWEVGRSSDDNGYAYALWRRYECCRDKGALLGIIPTYICMP